MEWTREVQDALAAPFPEDEIEFLPRASANGRALALAHIDARSVMRRLDAVVGPDGWTFDWEPVMLDAGYRMLDTGASRSASSIEHRAPVRVKGKLTVLGVTKCDAGEAAAEDEPLKAAVSDALKRCAVHFGIARYLYYLPQTWVPYDPAKRRFTETPRLAAGAVERALAVCGYQGETPALRIAEPRGAQSRSEPARDGSPALTVDVPERNAAAEPVDSPRGSGSAADAPRSQAGTRSTGGAAMTCASPGCGKPLTKGQHDVSMRAFGQPLCPGCQRQQARAA